MYFFHDEIMKLLTWRLRLKQYHQNKLNICKNVNPLEVVVYDEYYATISVVVMAFCLMVFYENLNLLGMEYQNGLYNYSWIINHIDDIYYNIYYSNVWLCNIFKKIQLIWIN